MKSNIFSTVKNARPKRHYQDLSHSTCFDFEAGKLIPFCCFDLVPGDKVKIGTQMLVRAITPFQAPQISSLRVKQYWFAVPFRILDENFPDFIAKKEGATPPKTMFEYGGTITAQGFIPKLQGFQWLTSGVPADFGRYSIADYLGLPIIKKEIGQYTTLSLGGECLAFPWLAYNMIWNQRFRDEQLQAEHSLYSNDVLNVNWKKDYFTSAFLSQQVGTEPVVSTQAIALEAGKNVLIKELEFEKVQIGQAGKPFKFADSSSGDQQSLYVDNSGVVHQNGSAPSSTRSLNVGLSSGTAHSSSGSGTSVFKASQLTGSSEDFRNAEIAFDDSKLGFVFTPSDMRLAFAAQRFQEMLMLGGQRYEEYTRMMFGVSPGDSRLQEPEYIGGCMNPVVVSEVVQTSASSGDEKLGKLGGHGIGAGVNYIGSYYAKEHCLIMGLMYLAPDLMYSSQGIPKWLSRRVPEDYYTPPFAFLSEQPIFNKELYYQDSDEDNEVFGYQGIWNDMRCRNDDVRGALRDDITDGGLNFWHMARKFASLPHLNSDFITMHPTDRVFGIEDVPHWLAACNITIKAFRPMPKYSDPGAAGQVYGMR